MDRIISLGLLKDIKNGEYRVVLTPAEVAALSDDGIRVMVASGAGAGSSIRLRRQPKHNPTIYIRNSDRQKQPPFLIAHLSLTETKNRPLPPLWREVS